MNTEFAFWLAGFFDGEGSIQIRLRNDKTYKNNKQVIIRIEISQKDKTILENIKSNLGIGNIYYDKRGLWSYQIYSLSDVKKFLDTIEGKCVAKKEKISKLKQIIPIIESGSHLTLEGLNKIKVLM
jgi:hypothetical protein